MRPPSEAPEKYVFSRSGFVRSSLSASGLSSWTIISTYEAPPPEPSAVI